MRKIILIGIALASAMGFTSCRKESVSIEQQSGKLITETFSAAFEKAMTKTAVSAGGDTVTWSANDTVHYYTADNGAISKAVVSSAGPSATLTLERGDDDTYYNLVYAGGTVPTFTTRTSSSMVFNGVGVSQNGTFANANVSVARATPGDSGITFKPVTALVKFTTDSTNIKTIVLTGGAGIEKVAGDITVDPTAASPTGELSGEGSTDITVTIGTPAAGTYYISVLPSTYPNGLKLTLKDTNDNIIGTVAASESIDLSKGGAMINLAGIDSHIVPPTDLSKDGTANCYIVSSAGPYKFKAVKGNSAVSVGDVKGVKVLWETFGTATAPNEGDLIKADVSYADNYITFSTGSQFPAKKGNAVIAAYSDAACSEGNVLWSWHIWLTDQPTGQGYNHNAGTMMDRNLGAIDTVKGSVGALGLLYQWGRKDPFPGADSISYAVDANKKLAASTLSPWPLPENVVDNSTVNDTNLKYTIANPATFIKSNNDPYDWYCPSSSCKNDTLWKVTSGKTIYDPCPPGWRVPIGGKKTDGGVWCKAFDKDDSWQQPSNWDGTNKGMDFGKTDNKLVDTGGPCWYPAAGYLSSDVGSLNSVGSYGYYWSCTPGGKYAYRLSFYSNGYVYPSNYDDRAGGRSVRCVSDSK